MILENRYLQKSLFDDFKEAFLCAIMRGLRISVTDD